MRISEPVTRHKDEEDDKADSYQYSEKQDHQGSLVHKLSNVGFFDSCPIHKSVFAKAGEGKDRIDGVLLRREGVNADSERKNELLQTISDCER